jgi:hypothetical protein
MMAQLINHWSAAGHRMAAAIVRSLSGVRFHQAERAPDRMPRQSLSSLPVEILLHIKDFLPLSSAACLILCSRHMMTALGSRSLYSMRADDQIIERRRFLILLQKDLPDWLLCYPCSLFHPVKVHEGPKDIWRYHKEPPCVQENDAIYVTADYRIRYQHVQLLMNQYRFGRSHTKALEALSFSYCRILDDSMLEGIIWGEVVAGELLVRFNQRLRLLVPGNIKLIHRRLRPICLHLEWLGGDRTLSETIGCRLSHANNLPCAECSKHKSCRECSTWFHVGVLQFEGSQKEFQIEAWKYLGICETPYDPEWCKQAKLPYKNPLNTSVTATQWALED